MVMRLKVAPVNVLLIQINALCDVEGLKIVWRDHGRTKLWRISDVLRLILNIFDVGNTNISGRLETDVRVFKYSRWRPYGIVFF